MFLGQDNQDMECLETSQETAKNIERQEEFWYAVDTRQAVHD